MVQIEGGYFAVSGWIVATEVIVHTSGAEEPSKLREVHMESRDRQR